MGDYDSIVELTELTVLIDPWKWSISNISSLISPQKGRLDSGEHQFLILVMNITRLRHLNQVRDGGNPFVGTDVPAKQAFGGEGWRMQAEGLPERDGYAKNGDELNDRWRTTS